MGRYYKRKRTSYKKKRTYKKRSFLKRKISRGRTVKRAYKAVRDVVLTMNTPKYSSTIVAERTICTSLQVGTGSISEPAVFLLAAQTSATPGTSYSLA